VPRGRGVARPCHTPADNSYQKPSGGTGVKGPRFPRSPFPDDRDVHRVHSARSNRGKKPVRTE